MASRGRACPLLCVQRLAPWGIRVGAWAAPGTMVGGPLGLMGQLVGHWEIAPLPHHLC